MPSARQGHRIVRLRFLCSFAPRLLLVSRKLAAQKFTTQERSFTSNVTISLGDEVAVYVPELRGINLLARVSTTDEDPCQWRCQRSGRRRGPRGCNFLPRPPRLT